MAANRLVRQGDTAQRLSFPMMCCQNASPETSSRIEVASVNIAMVEMRMNNTLAGMPTS